MFSTLEMLSDQLVNSVEIYKKLELSSSYAVPPWFPSPNASLFQNTW